MVTKHSSYRRITLLSKCTANSGGEGLRQGTFSSRKSPHLCLACVETHGQCGGRDLDFANLASSQICILSHKWWAEWWARRWRTLRSDKPQKPRRVPDQSTSLSPLQPLPTGAKAFVSARIWVHRNRSLVVSNGAEVEIREEVYKDTRSLLVRPILTTPKTLLASCLHDREVATCRMRKWKESSATARLSTPRLGDRSPSSAAPSPSYRPASSRSPSASGRPST